MPEIVTCPECEKKVRVPDESLGKRVKCPGCSKPFLARAAKEDEDEDEEEPVAKRPASKSRRDDDDEDEDDRPRSRRKDEDEDEEEEEDDRPKKKKGKKARSSGGAYATTSLGLLLLIAATGLLVLTFAIFQGGLLIAMKAESITMLNVVSWTVRILMVFFLITAVAGHALNVTVPGKGDSTKTLALATVIPAAAVAISFGLGMFLFDNGFGGGLGSSGPRNPRLEMGATERGFWSLFQTFMGFLTSGGLIFTFLLGCFFLYSLASQVGRQDIGRHAILFLLAQVALIELGKMLPALLLQMMSMGTPPTTQQAMQSWISTQQWVEWGTKFIYWIVQIGLAAYYVLILLQLRTALSSAGRRG